MRIVLKLSYRGTNYFGWQIQPNQISVQQIIQDKIQILLGDPVELTGCGRTDTGVHARNFYAHFDMEESYISKLRLKSLNAILPEDIAILNLWHSTGDFHARFDASFRKYIYRLQLFKDPFQQANCYFFRESKELDFTILQDAAQIIYGLNEFNSFVKSGSDLNSFPCKILESFWKNPSPGYFEYHIQANRFVRGMVRLIVGMCINLALGKISIQEIQNNLSAQQQINKSYSIAAQGLTLEHIEYPEEKINQLRDLDLRV